MLRIGTHTVDTRVVLAPMVGVTDHPYRQLCARLGTRLAIAEMVCADTRLWNTRKSRLRRTVTASSGPRWVQIVGNDPAQMAGAARQQAELGAEIIDINMGCPAKNVYRRAAGSALLRDEPLVGAILAAVVSAVPELPVTLKIRTGWDRSMRNGVRIARIAEDCGIRALSVHGRTRADRFTGEAEYTTIRDIVASVNMPVIANGDIDSGAKAAEVLRFTGAAAVMIGRAAQGKPWLCASIDSALRAEHRVQTPPRALLHRLMLEHLQALHDFYGEAQGVRTARKHVGWYLAEQPGARPFLGSFYALAGASEQLQALDEYFERTTEEGVMAA
ncbi:MAG: tRNA dihydrouridine synthase DusB [Pseudomonadales bacterium]